MNIDRSTEHCKPLRAGAARLSGGPIRSVQFMLELAARRGRPLRAGDAIATGQTTGIHEIRAGESARVVFGDDGEVACRTIAARCDQIRRRNRHPE